MQRRQQSLLHLRCCCHRQLLHLVNLSHRGSHHHYQLLRLLDLRHHGRDCGICSRQCTCATTYAIRVRAPCLGARAVLGLLLLLLVGCLGARRVWVRRRKYGRTKKNQVVA